MRRLYSAGSLAEAYLLLHRLRHAGIDAQIFNEHAQGGLGDIPFTHAYPEVWVHEDAQFGRARTVVAEFESTPRVHAPRRCGGCSEENPPAFELCWHCGQVLG